MELTSRDTAIIEALAAWGLEFYATASELIIITPSIAATAPPHPLPRNRV